MCQLQKDMALRGKGLAWLPDCLIRGELEEKRLIPVRPQIYHAPYQVRLYRNAASMEKHCEDFWQQVKLNNGGDRRLVNPWCETQI